MSKENGGQAFPVLKANYHSSEFDGTEPGMTLRDYFAAKAMAAMVVNDATVKRLLVAYCNQTEVNKVVAKISYEMADAMIEARSK